MLETTERHIDHVRHIATRELDPSRRSALGQFMTPTVIADYMASLFTIWPEKVSLLDPGAGIGSLTEAFVEHLLRKAPQVKAIDIDCFEVDRTLVAYLSDHLDALRLRALRDGRELRSDINERDFIAEATYVLGLQGPRYTHTILNPPYKKINTGSDHRMLLRSVGIETVNLYTAFLGLAVALTKEGGEIVAIIPRSFCNGAYFRPFRQFLLEHTAFTHIHVFESRTHAFKDDEVLQENIIIKLRRGISQGTVTVSTSRDATFSDYQTRSEPFSNIVKDDDPESFIHIPTRAVDSTTALFSHSLNDLGLQVSTGPVVDFRVKEHCLKEPTKRCAPLLYAHHFKGDGFQWPKEHRKPNALVLNDETLKWLMPRGCYTITKRFTSKEERRRIVSYVIDPEQLCYEHYGFENHLNVFHASRQGLDPDVAHGLSLFLNSTIVDEHFRNFSGHTQVNATDLRSMRYPSNSMLVRFGKWARKRKRLTQEDIDSYLAKQHDK